MWRDKNWYSKACRILYYCIPYPVPELRLWLNMSINSLFLSRQNSREAKNARELGIQPLYTHIRTYTLYIAAGWLIVEKECWLSSSVFCHFKFNSPRFGSRLIQQRITLISKYVHVCSPRVNIVVVFTHKNKIKNHTFKSKM
jgi:hypothetical protein